ncbi:hypothetical protein EASAB2608_07868 [Streptomyces sp. EAS-AB2608]|uniref:hypothetical protein n=1 Tax=Streptomyces sp. EAS-AB2608 TaxID=2779671 RepID=UPI001BF09A2A|nr:hypothetical protein [Streptomyces sp. EAS-AB2608]BCM72534.1 hypothetical protein EASAB2608_07868 [Streptomyces sp. EAS-AB2608]
MNQATAHEGRSRTEAVASAEEELDLVIGELEQEIPARSAATPGTCSRVYCI